MSFINLPVNGKGPTTPNFSKTPLTAEQSAEVFKTSFNANNQFSKIEKQSQLSSPICTLKTKNSNGFLSTIHEAFANERPLVLSPDHIWAAIMQQVSIHVNKNSEELRHLFVAHEGKKKILVRHDGLRMGQDSPWQEVFPMFAEKLSLSVKDPSFVANATAPFSTTDETSSVVHTIALMDTLQQYFEYTVMTMCGIPRIELVGTEEDWLSVLRRAEQICQQTQMQWWANELIPVLFHFVVLAKSPATAPVAFWSRIYSISTNNSSGSTPSANGWINVFFPYVTTGDGFMARKSTPITDQKVFFNQLASEDWWTEQLKRTFNHRASTSYLCSSDIGFAKYPSGVSMVPFVWDYFGEQFEMTLCGGFLSCVGYAENSVEDAVCPMLGWTIAHGEAKENRNVEFSKFFKLQ